MKMNKNLLIILFFSGLIFAQDEDQKNSNNLVFDGNIEFQKDKFSSAEYNYRKAYSIDSLNYQAPYNLGNSLYKNNLSNEARFNYNQSLAKLNSKEDLHKAFHNLGNTFMKDKNYQGAVDNFKKALLNNPDDEETRYNYVLAKELLKNQKNKNDKNKDNKDNEDKKDNKDNKDNKDQDKKNEDDKDENKQKQDDKSKPKNNPSQKQISPQQLKSILEAMSKEEKKVQDKVNKKKFKGNPKPNKKDW